MNGLSDMKEIKETLCRASDCAKTIKDHLTGLKKKNPEYILKYKDTLNKSYKSLEDVKVKLNTINALS